MHNEIIAEDPDIEKREMILRQIRISKDSKFLNKTLGESGIRDKYNCMVVGLEEGKENLSMITPTHKFEEGDVIWVVGEKDDLKKLEDPSLPPL
jgi:CPA2 family monovalent cation:H+ antiporter-2